MPKQSCTKEETLNRDRTLRFRVNAVEEAEIEGRARNAGLPYRLYFGREPSTIQSAQLST